MKRILLSLTAVLFAVVGWAQSEWKDITSDYIKNAAMSIDKDQQTDWTLVGCTDNGPSQGYNGVSSNLVGINFQYSLYIPFFASWKTITYKCWHV